MASDRGRKQAYEAQCTTRLQVIMLGAWQGQRCGQSRKSRLESFQVKLETERWYRACIEGNRNQAAIEKITRRCVDDDIPTDKNVDRGVRGDRRMDIVR